MKTILETDFPYVVTRRDKIGSGVSRCRFRYVGDATFFVSRMIQSEASNCMWTVHNTLNGFVCLRVFYENGAVIYR